MAEGNNKKRKYGISEQPIKCTEAWVRKMGFDHKAIESRSFILINRKTGKRTHVNTYDGNAGKHFDVTKATYDIGDEKTLNKALKKGTDREYIKCEISECAVAEAEAE